MLTTMIIGNKIAEARKKVNISQAQLAEHLFISPQAVGKWERGESMPDIITFNRLAEILGVDLNYFSESFQSVGSEPVSYLNEPVTQQVKHEPELPQVKQNRRLSWDMSRGNWVDADFSGLKNLHEKFSSSNMQKCLFIGSDLAGLLLKKNNIDRCDFTGSDLSSSHFESSFLSGNILKNCSLKEAEFYESFISGCDFSGVDFTGTVIKSGGIEKSILENAVWCRTSFIGMALDDLVFDGTLEECCFENCSFNRVTFRNATLINTFFKNKNLKRVKFVDCKADKLTLAFLKNGKADLTGIMPLAE
jgi:uncharacterized protein YjbI with pentapeptide repeats